MIYKIVRIINIICRILKIDRSYFIHEYIENQAGVEKRQVGTIFICDTKKGTQLAIYKQNL